MARNIVKKGEDGSEETTMVEDDKPAAEEAKALNPPVTRIVTPPEPGEETVAALPKRYRIVGGPKNIHDNGTFMPLRVGREVSDHVVNVEGLRKQGVVLEEIED